MNAAPILNRAGPESVALETTLLCHGVPPDAAEPLARELAETVVAHGGRPTLVGLLRGQPIVGMSPSELTEMLGAERIEKANTANLGVLIHRRATAATTVSATMELAAAAGVRLFATGGIGGVHRGYGQRLDISADLAAFTRFPVAVVASGVKSLLDVESTREALEALGVPVVGFRTDIFPAFYLRESRAAVDARFDDPADLAGFVDRELRRTGRGIVIANPIPATAAITTGEWDRWIREAEHRARPDGARGRDVTPRILRRLHEVSGGATLRANIALVRANAALAAQVCAAMARL